MLITISTANAYRIGASYNSAIGDIPTDGNKSYPSSIRLFHRTGNVGTNWYNEISVYQGNIQELSSSMIIPFMNFGPRRYDLLLGASKAFGSERYINPGGLSVFAALSYLEEISAGLFITAEMQMNLNRKYANSSTVPKLSLGLSYFYDSDPVIDDIKRLDSLDFDDYLDKNMVIKQDETIIKQSDIINKLKDIKVTKAMIIPKFATKGSSFLITKEFSDKERALKVICKIKQINHGKYELKNVGSNTWRCKIFIPQSFRDSQVNIVLHVTRSDGSKIEEYGVILID